jgi:superfamily II DNA or RNA helicase
LSSTSIQLRPWQARARHEFLNRSGPDFFTVATPGGGKTVAANVMVYSDIRATSTPRSITVVTPTTHLKSQWMDASSRFGFHLNPNWNPSEGFGPGYHGAVLTYAAVIRDGVAKALAEETRDGYVILDEIHHAGFDETGRERKAWGDAIRAAFEGAYCRILLSGTPFRSDTHAIPFVSYQNDEAVADFTYGYADALRDGGVVRPVEFPMIDGDFAWVSKDGSELQASFEDWVTKPQASERLRTALSTDGNWLPTVLEKANRRLDQIRFDDRVAGGLVIATDVAHAERVAEELARITGEMPDVITSRDAEASKKIATFGESTRKWVVAVKMISEGVDIPRLRVLVYATTVSTELFIRQAVGRVIRWRSDLEGDQDAVVYMPRDPRFENIVREFSENRTHHLKAKRQAEEVELDDLEQALAEMEAELADEDEFEEFSAFEVLSAEVRESSLSIQPSAACEDGENDPLELTIEVQGGTVIPLNRQLNQIRSEMSELVGRIAYNASKDSGSRVTEQQVNATANAKAGITKVHRATREQLEVRATYLRRWAANLGVKMHEETA